MVQLGYGIVLYYYYTTRSGAKSLVSALLTSSLAVWVRLKAATH